MAEKKESCVKPVQGPILEGATQPVDQKESHKEAPKVLARVGKQAPDFEALAFFEGGFKTVKLSDYKGKWIVICFYPGDFTFV